MKLTVDASVVVKWSVRERLSERAKLLRAHRLDLHAPDLLLAECVNAVWKKARRGEIVDATGHVNECLRLPDEVTLIPISSLIARAAGFSVSLDHPVYDCLYLACAQETSSPLITADEPLANKVNASDLEVAVHHLGSADFARDIGPAGSAPVLSRDTVEALVEAYRLFAATQEALADGGEGAFAVPDGDALKIHRDSAARRRLVTLVRGLSDEERIDLLALGWFGGSNGWDWKTCFEHACREIDTAHENYFIRGGEFWRRGWERLSGAAP